MIFDELREATAKMSWSKCTLMQDAFERGFIGKLTGAFHALMEDAVQEGAAVITEGWRGIGVQLEVVTSSAVLKQQK